MDVTYKNITRIAIYFCFFLCICIPANAQKKKEKEIEIQKTNYTPFVKTLETTIGTLYLVISGDKDEKRDWDLFKFLFKEDARLITTGTDHEGKLQAKYMTPAEYIKASKSWMLKNGFHEKEINRVVHTFGDITQVFSTFEAYHSENDKEPFMKGINSIQFMFDGNRWWILNLLWTNETAEKTIPEEYLQKDNDF